jgi:hypothetical protein
VGGIGKVWAVQEKCGRYRKGVGGIGKLWAV